MTREIWGVLSTTSNGEGGGFHTSERDAMGQISEAESPSKTQLP